MKIRSHIQQHAAAFVAIIATLITAVNLACSQPLQPEVLYTFIDDLGDNRYPYAGLTQGADAISTA